MKEEEMDALMRRYAEQIGLPKEKLDDFVADYNALLAKQRDAFAAITAFIQKYEINTRDFENFLIENRKSESG